MKELNNLQKLASQISGYEHHEDYTSARDDGYYEIEYLSEKVDYLMLYGFTYDEIKPITHSEALDVIAFLDADHNNSGDWWNEYEQLALNNLQKVASKISGYGIYGDSPREDFYYDECLNDRDAQIHCIQYTAASMDNIKPIYLEEAERIRIFCNLESNYEDELYHAYEKLGVQHETN